MEFSEKLKRVRSIMNISQETLAKELNISRPTLNKLIKEHEEKLSEEVK